MKVQARSTRNYGAHSIHVLYGKSWETCEGTEGLTDEECKMFIRDMLKDDRLSIRASFGENAKRLPHEYRIVGD